MLCISLLQLKKIPGKGDGKGQQDKGEEIICIYADLY